jgi:hypothetical protein
MSNPLEDYLAVRVPLKKTAAFGQQVLNSIGEHATDAAGKAVGAGAVGLGAAAVGVAAIKTYRAIRKTHDFRSMMDNNPDLQEIQERDPTRFNAHYNSLRSLMPGYAEDPIISGSLMRHMGQSPESAGALLMSSLEGRSKTAPGIKGHMGVGEITHHLF